MEASIRTRLVKWYGEPVVRYAEGRGIEVRVLKPSEKYKSASASLLRLGVDVDSWPAPPAGLFVVAERTVYLRWPSDMTLAHEFAHGLDCALGGGIYLSGYDTVIRGAFARSREYVTPYAGTGLDEFFAESVRAYIGVNDPRCSWPPVSRARLMECSPAMHDHIRDIFAGIGGGLAEI